MEDLSTLAEGSMWVTSQAAGNRQSTPNRAMTAPGSSPVDRELPREQMADPEVEVGPARPVGTDPGRLHGGKAQSPDWSHHADGETGAGTYDEPSFGQARGGPGPWRQT